MYLVNLVTKQSNLVTPLTYLVIQASGDGKLFNRHMALDGGEDSLGDDLGAKRRRRQGMKNWEARYEKLQCDQTFQ